MQKSARSHLQARAGACDGRRQRGPALRGDAKRAVLQAQHPQAAPGCFRWRHQALQKLLLLPEALSPQVAAPFKLLCRSRTGITSSFDCVKPSPLVAKMVDDRRPTRHGEQ